MNRYSLFRAAQAGHAARSFFRRTLQYRLQSDTAKPPLNQDDENHEETASSEKENKHLNDLHDFTSPENELFKEVDLDSDGKPLFEFHPDTKFDDNYDWSQFERAFGIDKLLENIDQIEDTDLDQSPQSDSKQFEFSAADLVAMQKDAPLNNRSSPLTPENVLDHLEQISAQNPPASKPVVGDTPAVETPPNSSLIDFIRDDDHYIPLPDSHRPRATTQPNFASRYAPPGVTRKLSRNNVSRRSHPQRQPPAASSAVSSSSPRNLATPASKSDKLVLPDIATQLPESAKRRGAPWRQRMLESEMERIATPLLCGTQSPWRRAGGILSRALLAPNGQTLIIHYSDSRVSQTDDAQQRKAWDVECEKASRAIRAALASKMYAKRVPRIVFEYVPQDAIDSKGDVTEGGDNSDLDELFNRIASERATVSSCKLETSSVSDVP